MSANETAYRTADPEVIEEFEAYIKTGNDIAHKRESLSEQLGRNLWVNRGFGHGTRVVGFERFDSDKDGDLIYLNGDACLIVSSKRGMHGGLVVPNLRRKSGKEFAKELDALTTRSIELPGMPTFHLYSGDGGMRTASPALWAYDAIVYALWPCDDVRMGDNWESIPLSTYHLVREQKEQSDADQG